MYYVIITFSDNTHEYLGTYGGRFDTTPIKKRRVYFEDYDVAHSEMERLIARNALLGCIKSFSIVKCSEKKDELMCTKEV